MANTKDERFAEERTPDSDGSLSFGSREDAEAYAEAQGISLETQSDFEDSNGKRSVKSDNVQQSGVAFRLVDAKAKGKKPSDDAPRSNSTAKGTPKSNTPDNAAPRTAAQRQASAKAKK